MEFRDPPKSLNETRKEKWKNIIREAKKRRGEWCFVGNYSPGVPAQIRSGLYRAFLVDDGRPEYLQMQQDWEVTSRYTETNVRCDVYIRYIGGE